MFAVIGGGPAGVSAVETLRKLDSEAEIDVVSDEGYPFYNRKRIVRLISGTYREEELFEKGVDVYEKLSVKLLRDSASEVVSKQNRLVLKSGGKVDYDALLIASGGRPNRLRIPGSHLRNISSLYSLDDAKSVAEAVAEADRVVIIGGGTTAIKSISYLREAGLEVTVVEKVDRLWPTMLDREASSILEAELREEGVEVLLNEEIAEYEGRDGKVEASALKSGRRIPCELVIETIGMKPSVDFLKSSGVNVDRGVLVDDHLRTNVHNIFAAGDVAQAFDPILGYRDLHPNWKNAEEQGQVAAFNMAGVEKIYGGAIQKFSLEMYGLGVVAVGVTQGGDKMFQVFSELRSGDRSYRKFIFKDRRLAGALVVERDIDRDTLRKQAEKAVLSKVDATAFREKLMRKDFDLTPLSSLTA